MIAKLPLKSSSYLEVKPIYVLLTVLLVFGVGLAIGRNADSDRVDREPKRQQANLVSPSKVDGFHAISMTRGVPAASVGAVSGQSVIEAMKRAASHRGDDHLYGELSDLIGNLSVEEIRAVVEAAEQLPNQRDQNVCLDLVVTRWAKIDPQAAANYTQRQGARGDKLLPDVVTAWAEQDAAGASAWVTQLAPGEPRKRAVEALVSVLAEEDPARALSFVNASPEFTRDPMLLASVFGRWAGMDPAQAAERAVQLLPGPGRNVAMQLVGSSWAEGHPEAAYAWAIALSPGQNRDGVVQNILSSWASKDPQAVATIVSTLGPGELRDQITGDVARQWAATDASAALAWVKQMPEGEGQRVGLQNVLTSWVENEPGKVAEYISALSGTEREDAAREVAATLARVDVRSALKWAEQLSDGSAKVSALAPVLSRWAEDDPKAAAEFAKDRSKGEEGQILLDKIAGQWTMKDPSAALAWAQGLSQNVRETAVPNIISALAHSDPSAAAERAANLSGEMQVEAAGAVASQWAETDATAASKWAASLPEGRAREQAFQDLLNQWSKGDPSGAAAWLGTLPQSRSRDAAIGAFTNRVAAVDPPAALQWAATISDNAMRESQTEVAARAWLAIDRAGASDWIASSPLSEELKGRLMAGN